jgi:hypothetical protein
MSRIQEFKISAWVFMWLLYITRRLAGRGKAVREIYQKSSQLPLHIRLIHIKAFIKTYSNWLKQSIQDNLFANIEETIGETNTKRVKQEVNIHIKTPLLAQKYKLMGLSPLRYINHSYSLYFFQCGTQTSQMHA